MCVCVCVCVKALRLVSVDKMLCLNSIKISLDRSVEIRMLYQYLRKFGQRDVGKRALERK